MIIHRSSVREKDWVIEAFTREEGRVSFFAPGVRHVASRRAGHVETLMETNLVLSRSKRGNSLSDARVFRTFPRLRMSYERLEIVYDIVKLLRGYTDEGQGDSRLYDTVIKCFMVVDESAKMPVYLREITTVQLLRFLGLLPDLYHCTQCRRKLTAGEFSLMVGNRGFWCVSCGGKNDARATDLVKIVRIFLEAKDVAWKLKFSDLILRDLRHFMQKLLRAQGTT